MKKMYEDESIEKAECPTCSAEIPMDALTCPSCGQEFEEEAVEWGEESPEFAELEETEDVEAPPYDEYQETPEEEVVYAGGVSATTDLSEEEEVFLDDTLLDGEEKPAKLFWIGVVLILLGFYGGPVFSYLKDALRIDIAGFTAHETFGPMNMLVAVVGSIVMAIGVVLLVIGWIRIKKWRNRMEALLEEPSAVEAID